MIRRFRRFRRFRRQNRVRRFDRNPVSDRRAVRGDRQRTD